jgi:flagellum-specific ATP synthase
MPGCNSDDENQIVSRARQLIAAYEDMGEMIRLGAYRAGSDARTDEAIQYYPALEAFLSQGKLDSTTLEAGYERLSQILNGPGA